MQDKILPIRKQIHLKNFDYTNSNFVYFLTLCTCKKASYFLNDEVAKIIIREIKFRSEQAKESVIYVYCLMPDHLHLLIQLNPGYNKTLQNWVSAFKRYTTRETKSQLGIDSLWQKNFHEHIVRREESLNKVAEYIVNNPVRKGLVDYWEKYPYVKMNF